MKAEKQNLKARELGYAYFQGLAALLPTGGQGLGQYKKQLPGYKGPSPRFSSPDKQEGCGEPSRGWTRSTASLLEAVPRPAL